MALTSSAAAGSRGGMIVGSRSASSVFPTPELKYY
jgi:hypothetical protein